MRTTIRLPEELLSRAKRRAAEENRTLTSLIEEGLTHILTAGQPQNRKPVRLPISKASGGTLPGIDLNRSSDLEQAMES